MISLFILMMPPHFERHFSPYDIPPGPGSEMFENGHQEDGPPEPDRRIDRPEERGDQVDEPEGYRQIPPPDDEEGDHLEESTTEPTLEQLREQDPNNRAVARREDTSGVVAGGIEAALAAGRTVLEIGGAIAAHQLGQMFPETTFIVTDIDYAEPRPVQPGQPGVQLTRSDWNEPLQTIPTGNVNTILSILGPEFHGEVPDPSSDTTDSSLQNNRPDVDE